MKGMKTIGYQPYEPIVSMEREARIRKATSGLNDGILSITIPKEEEAVKPLPRTIEVK